MLALTTPETASAQPPPPPENQPELTVEEASRGARIAVVRAGPGGIRRGPAAPGAAVVWPYDCTWVGRPYTHQPETVPFPEDGQWYWLDCNARPGGGGTDFSRLIQYTPAEPIDGEPGLIPLFAIEEAAEDFAIPPVLPIATSPQDEQITGVETWFWPDGSTAPVQGTASAGGVTAIATATYMGSSYNLGDGNTLNCDNTPTEWTAGATSSDCTHTYLTEAPLINVTAQHQWNFDVWNSLDLITDPLDPQFYNQDLPIEVIDLEAVISKPGG